jgi:hypothetical protein
MSITAPVSTLRGVGSPLRLAPVTNLERMYALDEAWNARDWETFDAITSRARSSRTGLAGKTLRREAARIIARSPSAFARRSPTTRSSTRTTSSSGTARSPPSSHG